jgi:serine protease Do
MTPDIRGKFGIKPDVAGGVVVTAVEAGSAAEDERLQPGDVISMVGDQAVASPDDVEQALSAMKKDGRSNARLVVQNAAGHVRWVNLPLAAE